ncbi:MAG: sugar phosphate isomerase/epimerase family protein [Promethearchaeota archaeon]
MALNQNSCKNLNLIEFIKFSKDFNGVELNFKNIKNIISENVKLKDILELLEIYNLKVISIFRLKDFSLSIDRDYRTKVLKNFKQMIDYCYKLESDLIIINPSVLKNYPDLNIIPKWRIINKTRNRIKDLLKRLKGYDIKIGFEFLWHSSISTLSEAKKVLMPLKGIQENLGYIIDTFHYAKSKEDYNQLKEINLLTFLIQLSDLKYDIKNSINNSNSLKDSERIFPGEGDFNLNEFINFTQKIGYRNVYSIELKNKCLENLYKKFFRINKND